MAFFLQLSTWEEGEPSRDIASSDIVILLESFRALHDEGNWATVRQQVLTHMPRTAAHACLAHEGSIEEPHESSMANGGSEPTPFERLLSDAHPQPYIDHYLEGARRANSQ